ncbi:MAG: hypothetical protein O3A13_11165 [Proteobacteria bacterium]|nr:hypothetical protein [Pseudomonadota bacterium]MDA0994173.1 hypothetical protein [Pseudomonadota bacterium]
MAKVLAKRILKLMRGPIDIARGPLFVALGPKDPSVVFLGFNDENASVSDKDGVNLSSAAFIGNDDVSELDELETPWNGDAGGMPISATQQQREHDTSYREHKQNGDRVHLTPHKAARSK